MNSNERRRTTMDSAGRFIGGLALVAAVVLVAVPGVPAVAATSGVDFVRDAIGDVAGAGGDIVSARAISKADGTTVLTVEVDEYEDPVTSDAWNVGDTAVTWEFDASGDGNSDHIAVLFSDTGALRGDVYDANRQLVCTATASALPASSSYRLVFDTSCLGSPRYFHWWVVLGYDIAGSGLQFDHAPEIPDIAGPVLNPAVESGPSVVAVNPGRVFESRPGEKTVDGKQQGVGRRGAGRVTAVTVAGRAGVPGDAKAAVLNVAAIAPDGPGFVTVFPCGPNRPGSSTLNFAEGEVVANGATIRLASNGTVCVYANQAMHLIVDVTGYVPS